MSQDMVADRRRRRTNASAPVPIDVRMTAVPDDSLPSRPKGADLSGVANPRIDARYDAEVPWPRAQPRRAYIVCSTPRSGSGLLCRGLIATGVAGIPLEYANPVFRSPLSARWQCGRSLEAYVEAARRWRTGTAGTFGIKLHWAQFAALCHEALHDWDDERDELRGHALLAHLFGDLTFVRIGRRDLDRQAVSLWRASGSGVWSSATPGPAAPNPGPYDFAEIEHCRSEIIRGEQGWDRFFMAAGVPPFNVAYEDLVAAYPDTVRSVLAHAVGRVGEIVISPPETRQLADEHSVDLLRRFRADRRTAGLTGTA
jgi:LPS sulfotransferase NodH